MARITGNYCLQCGERLLAPEWSEHVNECCIRHLWACDACGYAFETSVFLEKSKAIEEAA
jgi:hypothetical protein